ALAASARGATVHLVTAVERAPELPGVDTVRVESAEEMLRAALDLLPSVQLVVMAAAVADYRVEHPSPSKLHRREHAELELQLIPTSDILTRLTADRQPGCLVIGFSAETEDVVRRGRAKLEQKGCDMIVANQVIGEHSAMGGEMAEATLLLRSGRTIELGWQAKAGIASSILDQALRMNEETSGAQTTD
ncbi:MAG: phosphopantothenoylcysteine decarboxylase, partial [Candidatus Dormiibacterota bacterium]